ncbi:MAG: indole-3-glycerol-phosphate synthase, partial [Planctomycetales bacterium]|nr:indole-3-glycerol-phosphate synthase [Planctomycetales bacterium]
PVLRKDFTVCAADVCDARLMGADAVLLIAECLDDCQLRKLHNEIIELGMTPLVEFYEPANMSRVLEAGATLVGVNNRDLRTFVTDLQHTVRMRQRLPDDCVVVGESGIHSRDDALLLQQAGVSAMLVGEHLMSQDDIGAAVDRLLGN